MRVVSSIRIAVVLGLLCLKGEAAEEPLDAMVKAVKSGDLATVEKLLKEGVDPNSKIRDEAPYRSLLALAISENHLPITEALLKAKADPAVEDDNGDPAMMLAADAGRVPHARLLMKHGVSIDAKNREGTTPLTRIAIYDEGADTKTILELGADPDLKNDRGQTALMIGAENANSAVVRALLEARANPNLTNAKGETALMLSVNGENPPRRETETAARVVDLLIKGGADLDLPDEAGQTALMRAIGSWQAKKETIEVFLAAKPRVDIRDKDGRDALFLAVLHKGRETFFEPLVKLGGDVKTRDHQGNDLLMLAARRSNPALVRELLKRGLSPRERNREGETALHHACGAYRPDEAPFDKNPEEAGTFDARVAEIATLLCQAGASPTAAANDKSTPLHLAAYQGNPAAVAVLLPQYPDASIPDGDGDSTLHLAALANSVTVLEMLLPRFRLVDQQNLKGVTPLMMAALSGSREAVVRLVAAGADIDMPANDGMNPLAEAFTRDDAGLARFLIEQGADPKKLRDADAALLRAVRTFHERSIPADDYGFLVGLFAGLAEDIDGRDAAGMTPLMWVAASNSRPALEAVLARQPDLQARSPDGRTALMWAASARATEAMKALVGAGADESSRDAAGRSAGDWLEWAQAEPKPGDIVVPSATEDLWERVLESHRAELGEYLKQGKWEAGDRIAGTTPLHLATGLGDRAAVATLLDRGAPADQLLQDRWSPLMEAAMNGKTEIMELLLKRGANAALRDENQRRAIDLAVSYDHLEAVRLLLKQPDALSSDETRLLLRVIDRGNEDLLREFLKAGARVDISIDKDDREDERWNQEDDPGAALISAAVRPDTTMLRILMESPDACGASNQSLLVEALHHAAEEGRLANVKFLIEEKNVDPNALLKKSFAGTSRLLAGAEERRKEERYSALGRATEQGHGEVMRYLLGRGAVVQGRTRGGVPPLTFAVDHRDVETARLFLKHKAPTELVDFEGETALHHAARSNQAEMVELLLEHGAKTDAKNDRSKTPVELAREAKAEEALKLLEAARK